MRRAFTLIELLVVITIIVVLIGLLMPVLGMVRDHARNTVTVHRLQDLERAIVARAQADGTGAAGIQRTLALGGVARFAPLDQVLRAVRARYAQTDVVRYPPMPVFDTARWSTDTQSRTELLQIFFDPITHASWQSRRVGRFFTELREVMPESSDDISAGWWTVRWPALWPRTNWDQDDPGTTPPLLRWPWGRPGLRRDGSLVDPGQPATTLIAGQLNAWVAGANLPGEVIDTCSWNAIEPDFNFGGGHHALTNRFRDDPARIVYAVRSDGSPSYSAIADVANGAEPFDLGQVSPLRSTDLVLYSGLCESADSYRSDRNPDRPWNDAWGRPLIVSFAIYQPERFITADAQAWRTEGGRSDQRHIARDRLLRRAHEAYGFDRAVYLALGAVGPGDRPELAATWNDGIWEVAAEPRVLRQAWRQIRSVCAAQTWNESTWNDAPWGGVRQRKAGGLRSFLSAPVELR